MLKELSGLPSNSKLDVRAEGCESLEVLFDASNFNGLETSYFNFLNCFKLNDNQGFNNMAFGMLKTFIRQGTSDARETFQIVIPGSKIPECFSFQSEYGGSLSVELPPRWNNRKFMGYALCAVFVLHEHHLVDELETFKFNNFNATHHLVCCLKLDGRELEVCGAQPAFHFSEEFCEVESDHLWLFYVSRDKYFGTDWQNRCSEIEFLFETRGPGLMVKKCGVRLIYEQDVRDEQAEGDIANTSIFPIEDEMDINKENKKLASSLDSLLQQQTGWQLLDSNISNSSFVHSMDIKGDSEKHASSSNSFLQWSKWQLLDSILPTGGFTHSFGLEAAMQARAVSGPEDVKTFVIHVLQITGSLLLPFVYSTTISPDLETMRKLNKMLDRMLTNNEVGRKASITQGWALMRVAAAVYAEIPSLQSMGDACLSSGNVSFHHAPAFGLICGLIGLDSTTCQRAYMFITMRDVIAAATRLNLVGPLGVAVLQHQIAPAAEAILNQWKEDAVEEASKTISLRQS